MKKNKKGKKKEQYTVLREYKGQCDKTELIKRIIKAHEEGDES